MLPRVSYMPREVFKPPSMTLWPLWKSNGVCIPSPATAQGNHNTTTSHHTNPTRVEPICPLMIPSKLTKKTRVYLYGQCCELTTPQLKLGSHKIYQKLATSLTRIGTHNVYHFHIKITTFQSLLGTECFDWHRWLGTTQSNGTHWPNTCGSNPAHIMTK